MENFLWMVVGALVSVWTGLAQGRYSHFKEQIQHARRIVLRLSDQLEEMVAQRDETAAQLKCMMVLVDPAANLLGGGQRSAAQAMSELSLQLQDAMINFWRRINAAEKAHNIPVMQAEMGQFPHFVRDAFAELNGIRPNWIAIIFGLWAADLFSKAGFWYHDFCCHLETGQPMAEMRELRRARRNQQSQE